MIYPSISSYQYANTFKYFQIFSHGVSGGQCDLCFKVRIRSDERLVITDVEQCLSD